MQRDAHVCQQSYEVKYGRPIWWSMQRDAHVCERSNEVRYGRPIWWGVQRGLYVCQRSDEAKNDRLIGRGMQRDAHVCQQSYEVRYGRPIGRGMQRGAHVCQRSNIQRMVCIILIFLLLNHFSSTFVFVITYHAARQIIERPCHLLSHVVHNSKLTTLPQSKRRCQVGKEFWRQDKSLKDLPRTL